MPDWNTLFTQEEFRWKQPHEGLTELIAGWKASGVKDVMDIGFGTGRHVIYLSEVGFTVSGVDVSENAIYFTKKWLTEKGLTADLKIGEFTQLDYPDASFDAVVSTYVLHHATFAGMMKAFFEIYRVLRAGGVGFVTLQSTAGYRLGNGVKIEENTYLPEIGEDAGIPHHFCDLTDISILMRNFVAEKIIHDVTNDANDHEHAHWWITFRKKA